MEEKIRTIIHEKVSPHLKAHFGDVSLVSVIDGVVRVKFEGACKNCPSANITLEDVVKKHLMSEVEGVTEVIAINDVSESLLDFAKGLLKTSKSS